FLLPPPTPDTYTLSLHDALPISHGGFNMLGPAFCSWSGGQNCDTRTAHDIDLGVFPLYFFGQNARTQYEVIPPLLHYYRYNDREDRKSTRLNSSHVKISYAVFCL